MKRIFLLFLTIAFILGMVPVCAYEFSDEDIIAADIFNQGISEYDTFTEIAPVHWFIWLPVDAENHKTYHDLLNEDFANTLHELLIPFDLGAMDAEDTKKILRTYNLPYYGIERIYYLNEIQQTFNAVYNTNIDFSSLDGLLLGKNHTMVNVIDNYFILHQIQHGTNAHLHATAGRKLNNSSAYWKFNYFDVQGDNIINSEDNAYTIISHKNVAGYDVRTIDYIGFVPPSDELIRSYTGCYGAENITVTINGEEIWFDQPPIMQNDRTLVPLRAIFEALGAYVEWNDFTQTATAICNGVTIKIAIGDSYLYKNGEAVYLDVPAMLVNDRTLVPVRAISEAFGCHVQWDDWTKTVIILNGNFYKINRNSQYEILNDFLNNDFENTPLTMQADAYTGIESDSNYKECYQEIVSYEFLDIDNDNDSELIITSNPVSDEYIPACISVWDCDSNENAICVLAKCGQQSKAAFRYFIIYYNDEILLLESTGEANSAYHISERNLYKYNGNTFQFENSDKIYFKISRDLKYDSEEIFIINGEDCPREYVSDYINNIDRSFRLYSQFENR